MDSLERAQALYDQNPNLPDKEGTSVGAGSPTLQPTNPYLRTSVPSTLTQAPDSLRQFTVPGAGQQRFFNSIPLTANQSGAPAQSQAQTFARSQSASLTLNDIANTSDYRKVPIEQFDSNGNLVVVNFQGAWNSSTTYTDGQEVSYLGNVWVATSTNTNSTPAAGNPFWELVGPQTLDAVADGATYGKVQGAALSSGAINLAASSGWVNKTLDHLPDGSTYAKVLGGALSSGNVDLAGSAWVNKNVDNVGDGSTYGRTKNSILQGNTIRTPHASTIAQIAPAHWWPFEALTGSPSLGDLGSDSISLTPFNISGSGTYGLSSYSLVNGDALLAGFFGNYCGYVNDTAGYPNVTISCWAYFNGANPPSLAPLVSLTNFSPAGGTPSIADPGLYVGSGGKATLQAYIGAGLVTVQSPNVLNWSVPHHLVGVISGNSIYLFVDGVLSASASGTGTHPSLNYFVLGSMYNGSAWVWNSNTTMQHVAVWGGALSGGQIAALYQAGATGAQSLDNLSDGHTWQRVTGVSGNQTSTSSYSSGSISSNYTASTGASLITFAPGTPTNIVSLTLSGSAQNAVLISGLYQCFWNAAISGATVTVNLLVNGSTIASYVINTVSYPASGQTYALTIPATYWSGTLAGATVTLQAETTNTTLTTYTAGGTNCYLTVGNFKA